jgi:hypothetical protein
MEKVIKDGRVAVLYSPDYGAGWYTWNREYPEMIFDPTVVMFVEEGELDKVEAYATLKWPDAYLGGLRDLRIEWIPEGTAFKINEYDGNESIETRDGGQWIVA